MSFRLRLTLFFVIIVVLPMIALAVLVSQIASDSESGKADARLSSGLHTATTVYENAQADSARDARRIASAIAGDPQAVEVMRSGSETDLADLLRKYGNSVAYLQLTNQAGAKRAIAKSQPVALANVDLTAGGQGVGTVTTASVSTSRLLSQVEDATGEDAALIGPNGTIESSAPVETSDLPEGGETESVDAEQGELRVAATEPLGDEQVRVALYTPAGDEGFLSSQPKVAIAVAVFLLLAVVAVLLLLRSLGGQISEFLGATRRIGDGDFSGEVPVTGNDEMAGLATEFNKMSNRLSAQMSQLRRQRAEIEESVRRVGEAFASGLDRQALLGILIETAVGTCEADYGLIALSGHDGAEAEAGKGTDGVQEAALAAEERALSEAGPVEVAHDGAYAFASSLG